ncbi:MAG: GTPase ObgE [Chloroflexota bacterium]
MPAFLDEARIFVQGGNGGAGSMHFHREKYVSMGGPDGGDGGEGGDVILRADRGVNTLLEFRHQRRFAAETGQAGGASRMHGRSGTDLVIAVPVGTVVRDETGTLGDLREDNQMLVVAHGGKGGLGNVHFKTSTNQAPHFAEKGEPGQERWLDLELKVIAEAGLIGEPNAGKSTLLSVISAAHPKIADYPFTTLAPNLGVVQAGDYSFVAADIPGLIEGAHEGVGLGHEFLRHIERTLVLAHLIDGSGDDPMAAFHQINEELRLHDPALLEKPQIVVITKLDLPETQERWPDLRKALEDEGLPAFAISAVTHQGVDAVVYRLAEIIREQAKLVEDRHEGEVQVITLKPSPEHIEVERKRNVFLVHGETVQRLAVMTDLHSAEAVHRLQDRLKRMGVYSALQRAGAEDGSKVRIGDERFIFDTGFEPILKPVDSAHGAVPPQRRGRS